MAKTIFRYNLSKLLKLLPLVFVVSSYYVGTLLIKTPAPDTSNVSLEDIPALYHTIDLGWTLIVVSITTLLVLAVQLLFREKRAPFFSTPKKAAIYIYSNLAYISFVIVGSIALDMELMRGYFPIDADSISIPIFSVMLLYIFTVGPVNVATFLILRRYRSGLTLYNPYTTSSSVPTKSKVLFSIIMGILALCMLDVLYEGAFDVVSLVALTLVCVGYEFYGTILGVGRSKSKTTTTDTMAKEMYGRYFSYKGASNITKLEFVILHVISLGMYGVYWAWTAWETVRIHEKAAYKVKSSVRAYFLPITSFWLYVKLSKLSQHNHGVLLISAILLLSITVFSFMLPENLVHFPMFLIISAAFAFAEAIVLLPVVSAQRDASHKVPSPEGNNTPLRWVLLVFFAILLFAYIIV